MNCISAGVFICFDVKSGENTLPCMKVTEFVAITTVLDDQPGQYWIYANTDKELVTIHIEVDCE